METASRDELETLQLSRLPVASFEELRALPFTTKADLRDAYPFGKLAVPLSDCVRVHASSGTRGKPTVVAYTAGDLEVWTEVMARCLSMGGVRRGMVVHNAYGYGLFTGGLGFHAAAERLGATVVPVSSGQTTRQAMLMRDFGSQVLCCTPSYALHIAEVIGDASDLSLELGFFGAEPWTEGMRSSIESSLGLLALNVYGLSEIVGPGVACECPAKDGLHVQEDHFLVEVVDPETGAPVDDGVDGELVFTTLTKEAMPLLRYRTGDIASVDRSPCACGRTLARMSAIKGRRDDMLIIRGVNLYPSEVERVLLGVDGIAPHYQLVLTRAGALDELTVQCEGDPGAAARAERALQEAVGFHIHVELCDVPRSEGKAVRVIDRR